MKIIITESQLNYLLMEGNTPEMEDYDPSEDVGMRGTKKPLGMDYFPKNLIFKILEYNKLKFPNDSEIVNFETKIKNQNRLRREDRKKMDKYIAEVMNDCGPGTEVSEKYSTFCYWSRDLIMGDSDNRFSLSYGWDWSKPIKNAKENSIDEEWTDEYKRSINCSNPKGFSQKAHCAARRKRQRGEKTKSKSPF